MGRILQIVCGILLTVAVSAAHADDAIDQSQGAQPAAASGNEHAAPEAEPSTLSAIEDGVNRIASALEAERNDQDAQRHAQDDLRAQQDMAKWALAMVIATAATVLIGIAGLILIWRTLFHTRIAAEAGAEIVTVTRDSAERQLRAYISIDTLRINTLAAGLPLVVWMTITNRGQTPARQIEFRSATTQCVGVSAESATIKLRDVQKFYDLGGGQRTSQPIHMRAEPLTALQINSIQSGGAAFVVAGYLRYRDVFGRQRRTIFRSTFDQSSFLNPDTEGHYYLTVASKGVRSS